LVKRLETVQVHFTLEGDGLRAKEIIMDEKLKWIPTWQTINNVSWPTKIWVKPTFKRFFLVPVTSQKKGIQSMKLIMPIKSKE
jgi:hypothetical protein